MRTGLFLLLCAVYPLIPFWMTTSSSLRASAATFAVAGGALAYFVHARQAKPTWTRWTAVLAVAYVLFALAALVAFDELLYVLSAEAARQSESLEQWREWLIEHTGQVKLFAGIGIGLGAFSWIGLVTLIASRSEAFRGVQSPPLSEAVKWWLISLGIGVLTGVGFAVLLWIPEPYAWLRIVVAAGVTTAIVLGLHNPQHVYRRLVVWLVLFWIAPRVGMGLLGEVSKADLAAGPITLKLRAARFFTYVNETIDWSLNFAVALVVVALLVADYFKGKASGPRES